MREAAKAHCQLEDFANARSVYATMATRYDGFHRQRAETRLAEIAKAFEDIREGKEEIANQPDPTKRAWLLYDLAFLYRYALGCDKKARDVYRQILAMDVPGIVKRNAEEWLQETRTRYESG